MPTIFSQVWRERWARFALPTYGTWRAVSAYGFSPAGENR
ncbi:hypothetical protein ACVWY3_005890 [Bradyrhizobium sp. USDA 4486]